MKIELVNVKATKLHDEFIASNIIPLLVETDEVTTWITFEDNIDMDKVNDVIAHHNPLAIDPVKPTELELLQQQLEEEQKSNATINDTLMQFMDFYFSQNPEQA